MVLLIVATLGVAAGSRLSHPQDHRLRIVLAQDAPSVPSFNGVHLETGLNSTLGNGQGAPLQGALQNGLNAPAPIVKEVEPTREYKEHIEKVYRDKHANKEVVVHQDKLEHKIVHLKEQVKSLSSRMTKTESAIAIYRAESKALDEEWDKKGKKDLSVEGGDLKTKETKAAEIDWDKPSHMEQSIGEVASVILLGLMFLGIVTFFLMMRGDPKLTLCTWQLIENVAAIFLAVMWFQAFDHFLTAGGFESHWKVTAAFLHALVLFSICVLLAWSVRDKHRYLAALTAVGAHYVSFSGLHWSMAAHETIFGWHWAVCLLGVFVFLLLLVCAAVFHHQIKTHAHMDHQEWEDSVDEVENDVGGMILAFAWTTFIRYLILGRFPEHEPEPGEPRHTALQRGLFLGYAVLMAVLAFFVIRALDHWMLEHSQTASRVMIRLHLLCYPFFTMSVAWAFLMWGEWEFYESRYAENPVLGRAAFAIICTAVCLLVILGFSMFMKRRSDAAQRRAASDGDDRGMQLAKIQAQVEEERERDIRRLIVNLLSLIVAFSWEETFDAAIEGAVEGDTNAAASKVLLAIVVAICVLPVYIFYLRPHVDALDHELHPDPDHDA